MRILIDIGHPAHANFFRNPANILRKQGHTVIISVLHRGRLPKIVREEYPDFNIIKSGTYKSNKWSIIFQANILRFFIQLYNVFNYKIDFGLSVGSFTLGAALKIKGKKNIQFDDDPERGMNVFLERMTATKIYFPPIIKETKKISTYNALKEWSYLSPKYFLANKTVLEKYKVKPKNYIFIREVQTKSLNYSGQNPDIILGIADKIKNNITVLLSLEDKSKALLYPKNWIILKEPVDNIHSLIYFSTSVISSGDSMAREGAMLGVPSIYAGYREMNANKILIDKGMLVKKEPNEIPQFLNNIFEGKEQFENQDLFRENLLNEWTDINELIINKVNNI
ncbi:MAG TPA: DUF354 domain-containing protein [Bacteroidales bacterium]